MTSPGWDMTLEGVEEQSTNVAARRVGIYASPGVCYEMRLLLVRIPPDLWE